MQASFVLFLNTLETGVLGIETYCIFAIFLLSLSRKHSNAHTHTSFLTGARNGRPHRQATGVDFKKEILHVEYKKISLHSMIFR